MQKFMLLVVLGCLSLNGAARADILAYTSAATVAPNQSYGSGFGLSFTVNQTTTVTQLGLYSGLGTGFNGTDYSTLFNNSGGTELAQLTFDSATPGTQAPGTRDFLQALSTPVTLTPGNTYSIVAFYTDGTDELSNSNGNAAFAPAETGTPYLNYVGSGINSGATKDSFPGGVDAGPANRYHGPTFAFTVPEPASMGLLALASLGLLRRYRRGI